MTFDRRDAARLALEHFALEVQARKLPGERDSNFLLLTDGGQKLVLKISRPGEAPALIALQNDVFQRLAGAQRPERFPRLVPTREGAPAAWIKDRQGFERQLRVFSFVPGVPLARYRPHSQDLLQRLGAALGRLDRVLADIESTAAHRELEWDAMRSQATLESYQGEISNPQDRDLIAHFRDRFEREAASRLNSVRRGLIHGDANDHNVLVESAGPFRAERIGLIDFGDIVHSALVSEPAVAAAYALLGKPDPVGAAADLLSGYHAQHPLREDEIEILFDLICIRLCVSVSISARRSKESPGSEYHRISERPAWDSLRLLAKVPAELAHCRFRNVCGYEPCARSASLRAWLAGRPDRFGPVIELGIGSEPTDETSALGAGSDGEARSRQWCKAIAFDLGVAGTEIGLLDESDNTALLSRRLFDRMAQEGAVVGIGRYDEVRAIYTSDAFRSHSNQREERRTVHLGIDLFQPAGSPVLAPLDGRVHSLADNATRLDYGPTIILEHAMEGDEKGFFTLYGHLDPECLERLTPGAEVRRGERLALIGDYPANGDWPPHLHFQLIVDLLGREGEFPGVAAPSQRQVWLSLCPDPNLILGIPPGMVTLLRPKADEILDVRRRSLGPSLSLSYKRPLTIVRGQGQFLYDDWGQPYLDAVNNVCHVGHCHPRVVRAIQEQAAVLNTNTRYLHANLTRYLERLTQTLPDHLEVCFLTCSGSEANDLALRLARSYTPRRDLLVLDGAYHGNLSSLIEISPYKFDGPGGSGAPPEVHKLTMPDPYRGPYKGSERQTGLLYAQEARALLRRLEGEGRYPAAVIAEPLMGCGGQIVFPEGYLQALFSIVRAAGGVCIADEVQTGFGRVGSHFWAFQAQDAVPDIVTMGKPIGNGHPLAAVVTTREIAAAFDNGMEYFNSCGGNPVSCAAGLAVLDVIRDEGLQQHAQQVGERLRESLERLAERHPLIGDVRGSGLFLGVELVRDRETLSPAPDEAAYLVERMKDLGVLLSTDGPLHNVIKIKPPMVFDHDDADHLTETLDRVLSETTLAG